jgi:hypothetical protein
MAGASMTARTGWADQPAIIEQMKMILIDIWVFAQGAMPGCESLQFPPLISGGKKSFQRELDTLLRRA